MEKFVVCGVHTKSTLTGLNIQASMQFYFAVSEEEAIGKYIIQMSKQLPDHELFQRPLCQNIEALKEAPNGD